MGALFFSSDGGTMYSVGSEVVLQKKRPDVKYDARFGA